MIEASRDFVCIRIESYESEENQEVVRSFLNGRFANTAFCVLAPDGKKHLTRSGRSPRQVGLDIEEIVALAKNYRPKGDVSDSRLPDYNSFKLALNVASADQKVLVLVAGDSTEVANAEKRLRPIAWANDIIGRFEYDLETDINAWGKPLSKKGSHDNGIFLIKPDEFGLDGEVLARLPLDAPQADIATAMKRANSTYVETTNKKIYSEHVSEGRRSGKSIELAMKFGEDRDGDGTIDRRKGKRRRNE